MKIECILHRDGGTHAEVGGVEYHFRPDPQHDGRHIATVDNPLHAARFISITEGYRMLPADDDGAGDAFAHAETETERAEIEAEAQASAAEQAAATIANAPDLALLTREELVVLHEARFGRKPHHRLSEDKLRDLLAQPPAGD